MHDAHTGIHEVDEVKVGRVAGCVHHGRISRYPDLDLRGRRLRPHPTGAQHSDYCTIVFTLTEYSSRASVSIRVFQPLRAGDNIVIRKVSVDNNAVRDIVLGRPSQAATYSVIPCSLKIGQRHGRGYPIDGGPE